MKNILDVIWKRVPFISSEGKITINGMLGIVAKKSDADESWKAYLGVVAAIGTNENKDIQTITEHGSQLSQEEARKWFPYIKLEYRN